MPKTLEKKRDIAEKVGPLIHEYMDGHATPWMSKVKEILLQAGFKVDEVKNSKAHYLEVWVEGEKSEARKLYGRSWEDEFETHKYYAVNRGIGFCVIRPAIESDKPEYRYCHNDKEVQSYDKDGSPKTKKAFYAVVKHPEQVPMFAGYIWDTPEHREESTLFAGDVATVIARLLTGESPGDKMSGRGSSFNANMKHVGEFARGEV